MTAQRGIDSEAVASLAAIIALRYTLDRAHLASQDEEQIHGIAAQALTSMLRPVLSPETFEGDDGLSEAISATLHQWNASHPLGYPPLLQSQAYIDDFCRAFSMNRRDTVKAPGSLAPVEAAAVGAVLSELAANLPVLDPYDERGSLHKLVAFGEDWARDDRFGHSAKRGFPHAESGLPVLGSIRFQQLMMLGIGGVFVALMLLSVA